MANTMAIAQSANWDDACKVSALDVERRNAIAATGMIVDVCYLDTCYLEDHGTHYSLSSEPLFVLRRGGFVDLNLTLESYFRGETKFLTHRSRTGFLVAPDKIVTAHHSDVFTGAKIIFGLHNTFGTCAPFDASHIPKANVRTLGANPTYSDEDDYAIYTLDQPVLDRPFLRLRRSGIAAPGDHVAIAAHTFRLAQKIDYAGYVDSVQGDTPAFRKLYPQDNSSGAAIFNLSQGFVEHIVSRSATCGAVEHIEMVGAHPRWNITDKCPAAPLFASSVPASTIAAHVPALELLTTPLEPVVKRSLLSGPVTEPETTYTLRAAPTLGGGSPITYEVIVPAPSSASEPYLQLAPGTATTGTIARGSSIPLVVQTIKPALSASCVSFDREIYVYDRTHSFKDTLKQKIEIARSGFSVLTRSLLLDGIEMPYRKQVGLTVSNPHLVPVSLTFRATQNWLKLDNTPGTFSGPAQVTATVPPGATHTVLVGLSTLAEELPASATALYNAAVTITDNDLLCGVTPPTDVQLTFTPGTLSVTMPIGQTVPPAPKAGASTPIWSSMEVPENFCITNVASTYGVRAAGLSASQFRAWLSEARWNLYQPYSLVKIPLQAPGIPTGGGPPGIGPDESKDTCESPLGGRESCWLFSVGTSSGGTAPTCTQAYPAGGPCRELIETRDTQALGSWSNALTDELSEGVAIQPMVLQWTLKFHGTPVCYTPD